MFGISPLGWVHTLGSLPAIPLAAIMIARHGRITPRSAMGRAYFLFMLVGAVSVFLVAHQPVSYIIGTFTILALLTGYGLNRFDSTSRFKLLIETASLTMTVFLLMLPTVTEILRRVPDGHPLVTGLQDPLLLRAQGSVLALFLIGLAAQTIHLFRKAAPKP